MSTDLSVIGSHKVKGVINGETVELKTFWQDQTVVVIFFRRWGCMLCRLWAKELSEIAPVLHSNNIRLVGIGVQEEGSKDFAEAKYFDGDLYYVENQSTYNALGFKRFNVVTVLASLFWKQSRDAISKGRKMGLENNFKGDWVQAGGSLIVEKGGKKLHQFVMSGPGDHLPNEEILKCLGLQHEYKPESMANAPQEVRACPAEAKS